MPKKKTMWGSLGTIYVDGQVVRVRRERNTGDWMARGEDGKIYTQIDGRWHQFSDILKPTKFKPAPIKLVPDDDMSLDFTSQLGENFGGFADDPNLVFFLKIFKDENTGDRYQYQPTKNGIQPVLVLEYKPPKLLSPRDPFHFGRSGTSSSSSTKGKRVGTQ